MSEKEQVHQAQELLWSVQMLESQGLYGKSRELRRDMARLHVAIANARLARRDPNGWIDYFAAITSLALTGSRQEATALFDRGFDLVNDFGSGAGNIRRQLEELREWARQVAARVLPSLSELAAGQRDEGLAA